MLAFSSMLFTPTTNVFAAASTETGTCDPNDPTMANGQGCGQGTGMSGQLWGPDGIFTIIVNTILFVIGGIAVLMLIYGGIRYTISGGDEKAVTSAKNTILYAVIGIIVAVLAYAIVNFVLTALIGTA